MSRITVWIQRFADRTNLVLQWLDPDTRKRWSKSARTADRKEAEQQRADLEYELNHGTHHEPDKMTWAAFRKLFEAEYYPGVRPRTRECFNGSFQAFEAECHPGQLRAINERTLSAFVAARRQRKGRGNATVQASTIAVNLAFLRTALNWAVEQGFLLTCPKFPTVKVPKRKPQPVPAESFEKLLDKAPDAQTSAFLLCGWRAGLRVGEAYSLEREQTDTAPWVDWARERIVFPAGFVKAVEDQWVPLDGELRAALEALPVTGRRLFRFVGKQGTVLCLSSVSCLVANLGKAAGVKLTYKSLRKGFGCYYAGRVPAQVLQKLMRHSDLRITMSYYANIDAAVEDAIRARGNASGNVPVETCENTVERRAM